MITQSIIINLIPSGIPPRIKVSQYDTGAEAIEVTLLNGTEAYEIPADATVLLTGRTSGGQVFTKKATTASGSVATFGVIDAMTASAGTAKAEVEILDGQTVLGSANFDIYVEPSPVRKDNTAESDWSDLQAMANAVVAAGKKIDDAEQVVADATDAANKANEAITAIGDNVERSETAATSAEAAQTAAEAAQGKAESAQTAAETAEQSASASAATATTKATEAETNASAAAESADAAKAWAVGPSDELTAGTDTDNAKYYAAQAKEAAEKASAVSGVGIATATKAGIVKVDDDTIKVDADGTLRGAMKVTVDDALDAESTNPVQNKVIKAELDKQNATIGHLLILKITFSEEFKGLSYTVTGNGETFTGTVPDSLYVNLYVHGLDTVYTVSAEYEGETYTSEVETKDFYGVYFGELTAWQATITVTVTDAVAGAVEGALVTATSTEKTYGPVATDAEGKVTIKIGKAGTYKINATNGTDTAAEVSVDVLENGMEYPVNMSVLKIVTWADGTDEEVAAMVAAADRGEIKLSDYWSVGDERKVNLSAMAATGVSESHAAQTVTMVLMNEGGVPLADGSECNFVVGQKNGLTENGYMNSSNTNSGSWGNCARRKWCNEVYFAALPTYLQNMFKKMTTKTPLAEGAGAEVQTVEDMIALPASAQVWKDDATATASRSDGYSYCAREDFSIGLEQWEWFKTPANRVKKQGDTGSACDWWERSPSSFPNYVGQCFCEVYPDGPAGAISATHLIGLAPFGCI